MGFLHRLSLLSCPENSPRLKPSSHVGLISLNSSGPSTGTNSMPYTFSFSGIRRHLAFRSSAFKYALVIQEGTFSTKKPGFARIIGSSSEISVMGGRRAFFLSSYQASYRACSSFSSNVVAGGGLSYCQGQAIVAGNSLHLHIFIEMQDECRVVL